MTLRRALVLLVVLVAPLGVGCGGDSAEGARGGAQNPNPPAGGIGPSGGVGAAPRDMPGGGRGSTTPHGK